MNHGSDEISETPGHILEGGRVAILDPHAIEEGRLAAHDRSQIGAQTESPGDSDTDQLVTREIVHVRLSVLEEARVTALDDLAVIQGKIIGLREILAAPDRTADS